MQSTAPERQKTSEPEGQWLWMDPTVAAFHTNLPCNTFVLMHRKEWYSIEVEFPINYEPEQLEDFFALDDKFQSLGIPRPEILSIMLFNPNGMHVLYVGLELRGIGCACAP